MDSILLYIIVFVSFAATDGVDTQSVDICRDSLLCGPDINADKYACVNCPFNELINVTKVQYSKSNCAPNCCPGIADCIFDAPSEYTDIIKTQCNDKNSCNEIIITGSGKNQICYNVETDYIRVTHDCYNPDDNITETTSDVPTTAPAISITHHYITTSASNQSDSSSTASTQTSSSGVGQNDYAIIGGAVAGAMFFIIIITAVCISMAKYGKPCALPHIKIKIRSPVSFIRENSTGDPVTEQSGCNNPGFTHTSVTQTPSKHFAGAKVVNTPQQAIDMTNMATIEPDILNDIPGRTSAINLPLPDIPPDDDALYSNISLFSDDYNDGSITYNLGYTKINPSPSGPKPAAMFSLDVPKSSSLTPSPYSTLALGHKAPRQPIGTMALTEWHTGATEKQPHTDAPESSIYDDNEASIYDRAASVRQSKVPRSRTNSKTSLKALVTGHDHKRLSSEPLINVVNIDIDNEATYQGTNQAGIYQGNIQETNQETNQGNNQGTYEGLQHRPPAEEEDSPVYSDSFI